MFGRRKVASLVAEFLGTAVLTLLIFSVQRSQLGLQYFVALAAGIAVAAMTFAFGEVSGAQFNPIKALGYIVVQVAGAYAAFGIYRYYSGTHLSDVGGHATWKIFTAEAVGTFILAMGYASTLYKSYSQSSKAIFYGLAYTVGILIASSAAIGILNPAVAAGLKALVWGTYIAGPVVGGLVGIFLYTVLFADSGVEGVLALETVTVVEATASSPRSTTKKTTVKKTTAKRKTTRKRA
jgi:glycerol uptake facilitator-like aquaporin